MTQKPKTLISILAHGAAQATFNRHLPFWLELRAENPGVQFIVWMPANDRVKVPSEMEVQAVGEAEHNGVTAIRRIQYMFEFMAGTAHNLYAFFEYDSFCLGQLPAFEGDIAGNMFRDVESEAFKGGMYFHPPVLFTNHGLQQIAAQMLQMQPTEERGMWDRFMGLAAKKAGLKCASFLDDGRGFARNTTHAQDQSELRKAILRGARMIHGVKDEASFKTVQKAWELRSMQNTLEKEGYEITPPQ